MDPEVSSSVVSDGKPAEGGKRRGRPKGSKNSEGKRRYRKSPTKMGQYVQNLREGVILKCSTCGHEEDLTTAELATRAGVDESEVKKIERSKRSPDPEVLTKVMNTVVSLYKETEARENSQKKMRKARRGRKAKKAVSADTSAAPTQA